jgi:hypothetical protein
VADLGDAFLALYSFKDFSDVLFRIEFKTDFVSDFSES